MDYLLRIIPILNLIKIILTYLRVTKIISRILLFFKGSALLWYFLTSIAYFSLACSLSPLVVTISLNSLLVCLTEESLDGTIFSEVPWILILGFYVNKNHCEFINNCFCNLIHYFFFLQCQITTGSTSGHLDTVPYCMY